MSNVKQGLSFIGGALLYPFLLLLAGSLGISLVTSSADASLIAQASNRTTQSIASGKLVMTAASDGSSAGWSSSITNMSPGDKQYRYVDFTQGTGGATSPSLRITDSTPTLLSTDASRGIILTIKSCTQAWTYTIGSSTIGTCGGTSTTLLGDSLKNLLTANSFAINTAPNTTTYLQIEFQIDLIDSESVTDGQAPVVTPTTAPSILGLTATLQFAFTESQRVALTNNR